MSDLKQYLEEPKRETSVLFDDSGDVLTISRIEKDRDYIFRVFRNENFKSSIIMTLPEIESFQAEILDFWVSEKAKEKK